MNEPSDISLTHSETSDTRPCSLISIIPGLGMSSCRGRAEAFARRLSSKLRTLGSQSDDGAISQEDEPIINGSSTNTWMTSHESEKTVTDLQPLRHESDSFFDFECELESPGSPVDECEYLRLIETASNTPHNSAPESGYVCASAASSHSSSDGPCFDGIRKESSAVGQTAKLASLPAAELPEYVNSLKVNGSADNDRLTNDPHELTDDESSEQKSLEETGHDLAALTKKAITCIPITGPDVVTMPAGDVTAVPLIAALIEISETAALEAEQEAPAMRQSLQDQILEKLKEQSDELKKQFSDGPAGDVVTEATDEENSVKSVTNDCDITHAITNGHSENAEQMLEVELTEIPYETSSSSASADFSQIVPVEQVNEASQCSPSAVPELSPTTVAEISSWAAPELSLTATDELSSCAVPELSPITADELSSSSAAAVELSPTAAAELSPPAVPIEEVCAEPILQPVSVTVPITNLSDQDSAKESPQSPRISVLDTTDDEDECRPQRVRRCSSLKTGKTPPGTPSRKKIVRFADVLGLDLADVKTFLDEIPTIPKSAFEDLEIMDSEPPIQLGPKSDKMLMPLFQQPGGLSTFLDLVREKQVSLENAAVTDHINQTITGSVRVRNLDFHKSVHIRYSLDGWRSYADLQANYVENSCDGFSDKFSFMLFGNSLHVGQRLEFAVRFQCKGQQFWDNNYGTNYCFQCLPTTQPSNACQPLQAIVTTHSSPTQMAPMFSPTAGDAWCSSFY